MRFVWQSKLRASPEVVFRFHERRDAIQLLTPPWSPLKVSESVGTLQPGTHVLLTGRFLMLPIRWVAIHTEYAPPSLFSDRQESGPFRDWLHRHLFQDDGCGGTILRDEIEFCPPFGWIGRQLAKLFLMPKLRRLFEYRHEMTRLYVEDAGP